MVELQKKERGPFYGQKKEERGPFPFLRNSRPGGGGGKWNENSFEICGKFQCLIKNVLTNERFRRAQAKITEKLPLIFAKMRTISPESE